MTAIAAYALRESLRRRVFVVILVLSVVFLAIHTTATSLAFDVIDQDDAIQLEEDRAIAGSILMGLAMFAILFLGTVLAIFLTLGAVRGDAERGVIQPLLVRPVSRREMLEGRFAAAVLVCAGYSVLLFLASAAVVGLVGDWWPDRTVEPALGLALAVTLIAAFSLLGSIVLSPAANGIAVFMLFGAGLTAGLLNQIGGAVDSDRLERIAEVASWVMPFEALYQAGLDSLTADREGITELIIELGPFGGAESASWVLWPYSLAYLAGVLALAAVIFRRRDL